MYLIQIFDLDVVYGTSTQNKIFFKHNGKSLKPLRVIDSTMIKSNNNRMGKKFIPHRANRMGSRFLPQLPGDCSNTPATGSPQFPQFPE